MPKLFTLVLGINIALAFPGIVERPISVDSSCPPIESRHLDKSLPVLLVTNGAPPEMRISIRSDLVRLSQASGIPIDLSEMDHKTISRDSLLMPLSFILGWNGLHPDEFLAISPLGVFKGNSSTTRQKDFFPSVMCRPLFGYDFEEIVAPRASLSSNTPLIIALQNMLKGRGKPSGHIFVIQAPFQRCGDD